jgi:hypothetical protein
MLLLLLLMLLLLMLLSAPPVPLSSPPIKLPSGDVETNPVALALTQLHAFSKALFEIEIADDGDDNEEPCGLDKWSPPSSLSPLWALCVVWRWSSMARGCL